MHPVGSRPYRGSMFADEEENLVGDSRTNNAAMGDLLSALGRL